MIRVGFIGAVSKEWMGGLNYFKNLLFALDSLQEKKLEVVVFVGKQTDAEIKNMFKLYAHVVEDSIFDRKSAKWFMMKIEQKIFRTNLLLSRFLKKNNIQVLSHTSMTDLHGIKTLSWIPDFQHVHLPHMFAKKELKSRNQSFIDLIKKSDMVILSSYDALKDFEHFAPDFIYKARVLQFVSQPDKRYFELDANDKKTLFQKYDISSDFFYMPNQFWKHKNHMMVFKAIDQLKKEGRDICLVCTGYLNDYRNKTYIDEIQDFITTNKLEKNIRLLGLVDYEDVFGLMKFSKAVINPSLFEGWSSTVEECKSVGKNMILSDLAVHKEQYPDATFFDRNSIESLKNVLSQYENKNMTHNIESTSTRTDAFGHRYTELVVECFTIN